LKYLGHYLVRRVAAYVLISLIGLTWYAVCGPHHVMR
jgi:hypothetical protein